MANINIQRNHQLTPEVLKLKIDAIMCGIKDRLEFQSEWETEQEFSFRRKGANGRIEITESNFELNLNLGIMYRALRKPIEQKINSIVDQHIK